MSETRWTKGPWVSGWNGGLCGPTTATTFDHGPTVDDGREYWPVACGKATIAIVPLPEDDAWQSMQANAHLIAAAPELYEELSTLVRLWDDHATRSVAFSDAIERAANLLEKARGESKEQV